MTILPGGPVDVVGAGVLPVFVTPENKVVFLLGQESSVPNWNGSYQWSAFAGCRKQKESDRRTAAREFVEETMGVLSDSADDVEHALHSYSMRVCISCAYGARRLARVVYVKQFPFAQSIGIEDRFAERRARVLSIESAIGDMTAYRAKFPRAYPFFVEGDVVQGHRSGTNIRDPLTQQRHTSVAVVHTVSVTATTLRTTVILSSGEAKSFRYVRGATACSAHIHAYARWHMARRRLSDLIKTTEHPGMAHWVRATWSSYGVLLHARVQPDFMEKSVVKLCALEDSDRRLINGQPLRPNFVPVFEAVHREFAKAMAHVA